MDESILYIGNWGPSFMVWQLPDCMGWTRGNLPNPHRSLPPPPVLYHLRAGCLLEACAL